MDAASVKTRPQLRELCSEYIKCRQLGSSNDKSFLYAFLSVSGLIRPPLPQSLIAELKKRRVSVFILHSFAKSRFWQAVTRNVVSRSISWLLPYSLQCVLRKVTTARPGASAGDIGIAFSSLAVLAGSYLNLDYLLLTSILPIIVGALNSHSTRGIIENNLDSIDVPRLLGKAMLGFASDIEDGVLKFVNKSFLEPETLNSSIERSTGINLNLQNMQAAQSFTDLKIFLNDLLRRHMPLLVCDFRKTVLMPLLHNVLSYVKDFLNVFTSVLANDVPQRLLSPPSTPHSALVNYYLGSTRVMDSQGQYYLYDELLNTFNRRIMHALSPLGTTQDLTGFSPLQSILLGTFLAPDGQNLSAKELALWGKQWTIRTSQFRATYYPQLMHEVTGFLGVLQLTATIINTKVKLNFFIEHQTGPNTQMRRLTSYFRKIPLTFTFSAFSDGAGGDMVVSQNNQHIATIRARCKPLIIQTLEQADLAASNSAPLRRFLRTDAYLLQGSIGGLSPAFSGIENIEGLEKDAKAFEEHAIVSTMLNVEYYHQTRWFDTEFYLTFTVPEHFKSEAYISVVMAKSKATRMFSFDMFEHQTQISRLPSALLEPCQPKRGLFRTVRSNVMTFVKGTLHVTEHRCTRSIYYSEKTGWSSGYI